MFSLKSITSNLKGLSSVRSVLSSVPSISSLAFPPQVQMGIKAAGLLGINVPSTPAALAQRILGKDIDTEIKGIATKVGTVIDGISTKAEKIVTDIDKIDWLL